MPPSALQDPDPPTDDEVLPAEALYTFPAPALPPTLPELATPPPPGIPFCTEEEQPENQQMAIIASGVSNSFCATEPGDMASLPNSNMDVTSYLAKARPFD